MNEYEFLGLFLYSSLLFVIMFSYFITDDYDDENYEKRHNYLLILTILQFGAVAFLLSPLI